MVAERTTTNIQPSSSDPVSDGSGDTFALPALLPPSKRPVAKPTDPSTKSLPSMRRRESYASAGSSCGVSSLSHAALIEDITDEDRGRQDPIEMMPSSPSPRVVRFASSEVQMYASWYHADVSLVRALVLECGGDRGLVVAALQEHQRQMVREQQPPSTSPSPMRRAGSLRRSGSQQRAPSGDDSTGGAVLHPHVPRGELRRSASATSAAFSPRERFRRRSDAPSSLAEMSNDAGSPSPSAPTAPSKTAQRPVANSFSIGSIFEIAQSCSIDVTDHDVGSVMVGSRLPALMLAPLLKDEHSKRKWIEEKERNEVLRLWRTSKVCAIQVAAAQTQALEAEEHMIRSLLNNAEDDGWSYIMVGGRTGVEELRARDIIEAGCGESLVIKHIGALMGLHDAGRREIVCSEQQVRTHLSEVVFLRGIEFASVLRNESHQRTDLWQEYLLVLHLLKHRRACAERRIEEGSTLQRSVVVFEASFRIAVVAYESEYRNVLSQLFEQMKQLSVVFVEEPWHRRQLSSACETDHHCLFRMLSWAANVSVPFSMKERQRRAAVLEEEADASAAMAVRIQYQHMKVRHHLRSACSPAEQPATGLSELNMKVCDVTVGLFMELEATRRQRIVMQWTYMVRLAQGT